MNQNIIVVSIAKSPCMKKEATFKRKLAIIRYKCLIYFLGLLHTMGAKNWIFFVQGPHYESSPWQPILVVHITQTSGNGNLRSYRDQVRFVFPHAE